MIILIAGDVGSGKGTVGTLLSDKLNIPFFAIGQLLREAAAKGGEFGKMIAEHQAKGILVPDEETVKVLKQRTEKPDCKNGFIVDGFPRALSQAKILDKYFNVDKVVNLVVSEKEIQRRLANRVCCVKCGEIYNLEAKPPKVKGVCDKCGGEVKRRTDETQNDKRRKYMIGIRACLDYYGKQGKVVDINAEHILADKAKFMKSVLNALDR